MLLERLQHPLFLVKLLIEKKDIKFSKSILVAGSLALELRFLATGDSHQLLSF